MQWIKSFLLSSLLITPAFLWLGCSSSKKNTDQNKPQVKKIEIEVVNRYDHNTENFTQGLVYDDTKHILWESTGQHSASHIYSYPLLEQALGNATKWISLSGEYFGEGITFLQDKMYQLTWKEHVMFVYQLPSMKLLQKVPIAYEGWGITTDGKSLIISDGTSRLRWIDPISFQEVKHVSVSDDYGSLDYINELELVDEYLYANRWQTEKIIRIDTATGKVNGEVDLSYLCLEARNQYPHSDVSNGIAYDKSKAVFFLTGKYWPYLYEVKLK